MKPIPHHTKFAAFWIVLVALFAGGWLLMFYLPNHPTLGALALGFLAILILKHIGLALLVASPLLGVLKVASVKLRAMGKKPTEG